MSLHDLAGLEAVAGFESDPTGNRTGLYTDHLLVTILGAEVTNDLGALFPRVPDDRVL